MKPENIACPDCKGPMVSRKNGDSGQRFWGCKNFPQCRGTRDTDGQSPEERRADRVQGRRDGGSRWR